MCTRCYVMCGDELCDFFIFKQKTAYELRISDWSSDVCSSDLLPASAERTAENGRGPPARRPCVEQEAEMGFEWTRAAALGAAAAVAAFAGPASAQQGDPEECRQVDFSDVGWTDITATTALASAVLEALGYEQIGRAHV